MIEVSNHYRFDIQSLRAIAVLCVVIFHINPAVFPGGYIGVDIFFVISGYLIIGFIWRDLNNDEFRLLYFYVKRIYRLFPALFAMVFLSSVASYFILLPQENELYLKSMFSTLLYLSNFYFYTESNYFNDAMEFYPLLHTWSLSVEEQFYMLFPWFLIWVYKKQKKHIITILIWVGLMSLVLSEWYLHKDASFSFFASPTRFFQFIIGGIIAISLQKGQYLRSFADIGVVVGLVLISIALYGYNEKTIFPGFHALLPSLGTGFILYFGMSAYYSKFIFQNKLLETIGNASYSIYLWHWPLIVFYKLKVSPNLSSWEQVLLFFMSILLGIISWIWIENRFRKKELAYVSLKPILNLLGLSLFLLILSVIIFTYYPYKTLRYQDKANAYLTYDATNFRAGTCFLTSKYNDMKFYDKDTCITYEKGKKNYLLFGDSHAAHYYSAMAELIKPNETLTQATTSGCLPIIPYHGAKRCVSLNKWVYEELIYQKHFDVIVLSANWRVVNKKNFIDSLNRLLQHTDRLIVLGPSMEYNQPLPRLLMNLKHTEKSSDIYKVAGHYDLFKKIDTLLSEYTALTKAKYISTLEILCQDSGCATITENGTPINFDNSHFTHEGALYVLKNIKKNIFNRPL